MSPLNIVVNRKSWSSARQAQEDIARNKKAPPQHPASTPPPTSPQQTSTRPLKEGAYFMDRDNVIYKHSVHGDKLVLAPKGAIVESPDRITDTAEKRENYQRLALFIKMRDTVHAILDMQENCADEDMEDALSPPWKDQQALLKNLYSSFIHSFGALNAYDWQKTGALEDDGSRNLFKVKTNIRHFRKDPDAYLVAAIENFDEDTQAFAPGPIFERRILRARSASRTIETTQDAIKVCRDDKASLDIPYILTLLPHKDENSLLADFTRENLAYKDPQSGQWVLAEEYLSGDIVEKLDAIKSIGAEDHGADYARNKTDLEKALPEEVPIEDIDITLGMPWIPIDIIRQFAQEELGLEKIEIDYTPLTHRWFVTSRVADGYMAHYEYGTELVHAGELLQSALNAKEPTIRAKTDSAGGPINRELEKKLASDRMGKIKTTFREWILDSPDVSACLQKSYNSTMNAVKPRKFDASHLTFSGSSLAIDLQGHQRKGVARDLGNPSTLMEWDVGAGKTFGSIAACMEGKRHGHFSKPMFVVQNHLLGEFSRDFMALYPRANILVAEEDQFMDEGEKLDAAGKITKFVDKASNNDWDAILITKSTFDQFHISPQRRVQNLIDRIHTFAEEKDRHPPYSAIARHLGDEITKIKLKIGDQLDLGHDNEEIQDTAVLKNLSLRQVNELLDIPLVDERWQALLKTPDQAYPSFEALGIDKLYVDEAHDYKNLDIKSRITDVSRAGSAKAVSFKEKLDYLRSVNPDNFATLMTATPVLNALMELYVFQTYMQPGLLERKGIAHPDAWISMFGEMVEDTELAPETGYYRMVSRLSSYKNIPELMQLYNSFSDMVTRAELKFENMPELVDAKGKVTGSPQIIHIAENEQLNSYFDALLERATKVRECLVSPAQDNILKIINEARLATLDPRLVGLERDPDIATKVDICAEEIAKRYHANLATPYHSNADKTSADPLKGSLQMVLCNQGIPKGDGSFSIYEELKKTLVTLDIPPDRIAFIHDHTSDKKKEELFRKCRNGEISVLIGTTQKLGTGTNVQKRLIALHELDAPWRPGDVIQGRGRIDRQKNQNPHIEILTYIQEGSFDIYNWQMLERKARFIAQAKKGARVRKFNTMDEFTAFCEDAKNSASNDPLLLEKGKAAQEIAQLRFSKDAYNNEKRRARKRLPLIKTEIGTTEDHSRRQAEIIAQSGYTPDAPLIIGNRHYTDPSGCALALKREIKKIAARLESSPSKDGVHATIGSLRGISLSVHAEYSSHSSKPEPKISIALSIPGQHEIAIPPALLKPTPFDESFSSASGEATQNQSSLFSIRKAFKSGAELHDTRMALSSSFKAIFDKVIAPINEIGESERNTNNKHNALLSEKKRLERIVAREFDHEDRYKHLMRRRRIIDKKLLSRETAHSHLHFATDSNLSSTPEIHV